MSKPFSNLRDKMTDEQIKKSQELFKQLNENPADILETLFKNKQLVYDENILNEIREYCDEIIKEPVCGIDFCQQCGDCLACYPDCYPDCRFTGEL